MSNSSQYDFSRAKPLETIIMDVINFQRLSQLGIHADAVRTRLAMIIMSLVEGIYEHLYRSKRAVEHFMRSKSPIGLLSIVRNLLSAEIPTQRIKDIVTVCLYIFIPALFLISTRFRKTPFSLSSPAPGERTCCTTSKNTVLEIGCFCHSFLDMPWCSMEHMKGRFRE